MRVLVTSVALALATLAVPHLVAAQDEARKIIGHAYHCSAAIGDNAVGHGPLLNGSTVVDEQGKRIEFYINYTPASTPEDDIFAADTRPQSMDDNAAHLQWSLHWSHLDHARKQVPMQFDKARLSLDFNGWRELPPSVVMALGPYARSGIVSDVQLYGFAVPYAGRPTGAGLSFPVERVLPLALDRDAVEWVLYIAPLHAQMGYDKRLGEGVLDIAAIRAAEPDFNRLQNDLAVKEADYLNQCERKPVYENEDQWLEVVIANPVKRPYMPPHG